MRAIHPKRLRELRDFLKDCMELEVPDSSVPDRARLLLEHVVAALGPKRAAKPARAVRKEKQEARLQEWESTKWKVFERAAGRCENCGRYDAKLEADHMFGGGGRRVSLESPFTVWALCSFDHRLKTDNSPDAAYWLRQFIAHADKRMLLAQEPWEASGYAAAKDLALARLDALEMLGRAG